MVYRPTIKRASAKKPAAKQIVSEHVADRIREMVEAGDLTPGQRLPSERELAKSMGVSRPSLREALSALSIAGILDIKHGSGAVISQLDPQVLLSPLDFFFRMDRSRLLALFEARILIEPGIAALAASRISAAQLSQLAACLERSKQFLNRTAMFLEADMDFHQIIFKSGGNAFLERVADSLRFLGRASRAITVGMPGVRQKSHADHLRIFNAVEKRDCESEERAMRDHLLCVQDVYVRQSKSVAGKLKGQ